MRSAGDYGRQAQAAETLAKGERCGPDMDRLCAQAAQLRKQAELLENRSWAPRTAGGRDAGARRLAEDQRLGRLIGARLRARREEAGVTPEELGATCNLSAQHIRRCEEGTSTLTAAQLWAIASALGSDVDVFFEA